MSEVILGIAVGMGLAVVIALIAVYANACIKAFNLLADLAAAVKRLESNTTSTDSLTKAVIEIAKGCEQMSKSVKKVESVVLSAAAVKPQQLDVYDTVVKEFLEQGYSEEQAREMAERLFQEDMDVSIEGVQG